MKKILFYLTIALAIFFTNSHCAQDVETELGFKIAQQGYTFDYYQLSNEYLIFADCLEDILEDNSIDSEKKKPSSGKTAYYNTSFIGQIFSNNNFKKTLPAKLFFPYHTSLFIFICVFRL